MKKLGLLFLFCVLLFFLLAPIPFNGSTGAFNTISGLFWCETEKDCLHEIGHKLDMESGWVSQSYTFGSTIEIYLTYNYMRSDDPDPLVYSVLGSYGFLGKEPFANSHAEMYAEIFEYSRGISENVPEILRQFYDWERAEELLERYKR